MPPANSVNRATAELGLARGGSGIGRRLAATLVLSLVNLIEAFHLILSPWLSTSCGWSCRFAPTCSRYACQVLRRYGFWRGAYLAAYRLARCNPFGGQGYDPVGGEPTLYPDRPQE